MAGIMQLKRLFGGVQNMLKCSDISFEISGDSDDILNIDIAKNAIPIYMIIKLSDRVGTPDETSIFINVFLEASGNEQRFTCLLDDSDIIKDIVMDGCTFDGSANGLSLRIDWAEQFQAHKIECLGVFGVEYDGELIYYEV